MIKSIAKFVVAFFFLLLIIFIIFYFTSENVYKFFEEKETGFKDGIVRVYLFQSASSEIKPLSNEYVFNIKDLRFKNDIGYGSEPFLRCDLELKIKYLNGEEKFLHFFERKPIDDCSIVMSSDGYRHYDGQDLVFKLVSNEDIDLSEIKRSKVLN